MSLPTLLLVVLFSKFRPLGAAGGRPLLLEHSSDARRVVLPAKNAAETRSGGAGERFVPYQLQTGDTSFNLQLGRKNGKKQHRSSAPFPPFQPSPASSSVHRVYILSIALRSPSLFLRDSVRSFVFCCSHQGVAAAAAAAEPEPRLSYVLTVRRGPRQRGRLQLKASNYLLAAVRAVTLSRAFFPSKFILLVLLLILFYLLFCSFFWGETFRVGSPTLPGPYRDMVWFVPRAQRRVVKYEDRDQVVRVGEAGETRCSEDGRHDSRTGNTSTELRALAPKIKSQTPVRRATCVVESLAKVCLPSSRWDITENKINIKQCVMVFGKRNK